MIFAARVLRFGRDWGDVRWPRQVADQLVVALEGVPVRIYREGATLHHPRERTDVRGIIGHVSTATAAGPELLASLEIFDEPMVLMFLDLERAGRLARTVGLSLDADVLYRPTVEMGTAVRHVTWIRKVEALDCVSYPAAEGNMLFSMRGKHIAAGSRRGTQPETGPADASSSSGMAHYISPLAVRDVDRGGDSSDGHYVMTFRLMSGD